MRVKAAAATQRNGAPIGSQPAPPGCATFPTYRTADFLPPLGHAPAFTAHPRLAVLGNTRKTRFVRPILPSMRIVILILAWITPAAIAGALGWSGIWGSGSAFFEYLIPIPVAGGVLHVPSFVVAAAIILSGRHLAGPVSRYLPLLAFGMFVAVLSLAIDFHRLNSWLFTDYEPYGSPFRLGGNPLYLFIATDAFWVGVFALVVGYSAPLRYWLALPLVPVAVVGLGAIIYQFGGPVFEIGGSTRGPARGDELRMVYTSASYDEDVFRDWFEQLGDFARPWTNPNAEHVAVIFTNSMQSIKWGQFDDIDSNSIVATFCLYEEDRALISHSGYHDCFADRNTVEEDLAELVARVEICRGMVRVYPTNLSQSIEKYGEGSEQVSFVRAEAESRGLGEE